MTHRTRNRDGRSLFLPVVALLAATGGCAVAEEPDVSVREDVVRDSGNGGNDIVDAAAPEDVAAADDAVDASVRVDTGVDAGVDVVVARDVVSARDVVAVRDTGADVPADVSCAPRLVVNEVQVAGATAADEFVEIRNNAACAVALSGWTVRYAAAAGTAVTVKWTGLATDSIAAHAYVVLGGTGFTGATIGIFAGTTGVLAVAGGAVGIYDPLGTRVDSVGYGTASNPLVEGTAAPAPAASQSIQRTPDGADTNQNQTDFHVAASTPGAANR
ncbi:MAG: lamin tail domain-containing protein [Deltaproteobacteria bacterium]